MFTWLCSFRFLEETTVLKKGEQKPRRCEEGSSRIAARATGGCLDIFIYIRRFSAENEKHVTNLPPYSKCRVNFAKFP